MSIELAKQLISYREAHPKNGKILTQQKMVLRLKEYGNKRLSYESYRKWEINMGEPDDDNMGKILKLFAADK